MDIGQPEASASALQPLHPGEEPNTGNDLVAGWLGGAVGILVSNPLEVLKVRLQTSRHAPSTSPSSSRVGAGSRTPSSTLPSTVPSLSTHSTSLKPLPTVPYSGHIAAGGKPGLVNLWKTEGLTFFFAGAAGPILGLAFIDSAFFGGYGIAMQTLGQDRQDPSMLSRVFLAGAVSGASCALLQTPIEVVKCRAQAEAAPSASSPNAAPLKKLGSFKIAQMIAKKDGLRGFYIGGLMTACRDGISSGIFFWAYFVGRRFLRGQELFQPTGAPTATIDAASPPPISEIIADGKINSTEVAKIFLAGGVAGSLSAVVPYPFDIIKTRLQTSTIESRAHPSTFTPASAVPAHSSPLTVRQVFAGIHSDGKFSAQHTYSTSFLYSFLSRHVFAPVNKFGLKGFPSHNKRAASWAVKILGLKGFLRGIRPTVASSFVGSAVTITTFEVALVWLSGERAVGQG